MLLNGTAEPVEHTRWLAVPWELLQFLDYDADLSSTVLLPFSERALLIPWDLSDSLLTAGGSALLMEADARSICLFKPC
ncbi:hypothetical protein Nepgr_018116 [Nepenthes gracilis]|uniref:Uncharacterized protein n=1 Tax=Nepenthes gracilis TaxID=150966 RepID=A0AAD3XU07_NEPGR|nr:hypothetical protein Nepgr_018116 [Nepenthes gracilis]